jgi:hypothetical protein
MHSAWCFGWEPSDDNQSFQNLHSTITIDEKCITSICTLEYLHLTQTNVNLQYPPSAVKYSVSAALKSNVMVIHERLAKGLTDYVFPQHYEFPDQRLDGIMRTHLFNHGIKDSILRNDIADKNGSANQALAYVYLDAQIITPGQSLSPNY